MNGLPAAGPIAAIALAALTAWLLPAESGAFVLALVVACLVVPHGALDALSLRHPHQWAAYVALAALVLVGWWLAPVASLGLFFVTTVVHFAQGDAAFMAVGDRPFLRVAARGILPLSLPGVFHPDSYAAAIARVLESVHGDPTTAVRLVAPLSALATALCLLGASASAYRRRSPADIRELLALFVLFAISPPLLAIGLYLALWHGWRHALRVSRLRTGTATLAGMRDALRASRTTLAVSVAGFLALIALLVASGATLPAVLGPTLALLAALTVPHVVVVTALDLNLADAGRSSCPRP